MDKDIKAGTGLTSLERKVSLLICNHLSFVFRQPSLRHEFVAIGEVPIVSLNNILRNNDIDIPRNPHVINLETTRRRHAWLTTRHSRLEPERFVDDRFHIWNIAYLFVVEAMTSPREQCIELSLELFVDGEVGCEKVKGVRQCCPGRITLGLLDIVLF